MTDVARWRRRLRARRRRRRWRSRRVWMLLAGAVALLGVLAWVGWFSSLLSVRRIDVVGVSSHSAAGVSDRVAAAARRAVGEPLARVDTGAVRDAVAAIPGIETVQVRRSWPSTLRVVVTERSAVAVTAHDGALWLLDGHGVLFHRVSTVPSGLPRLEVSDAGPDDRATRAALTAVRAMPATLRAAIRTVSAPTPDSVRIALRDGRSVVWGGPDHSGEKGRILPALLRQPGTVYDVSTPSVVVVR